MARDNYNYGKGKMGNNKEQNKMVKEAARQVGVDPDKLSDYIHECKDDWYGGDYSFNELVEMAKELKKMKK